MLLLTETNIRVLDYLAVLEKLLRVISKTLLFLLREFKVCPHAIFGQIPAEIRRHPGRAAGVVDNLCSFWLECWDDLQSRRPIADDGNSLSSPVVVQIPILLAAEHQRITVALTTGHYEGVFLGINPSPRHQAISIDCPESVSYLPTRIAA
jgi:hypothetical protein